MCFLLGKDSNLIPLGLMLYHRPVENTLILRGFRTDSTRKRSIFTCLFADQCPGMAQTRAPETAIGSLQLAVGSLLFHLAAVRTTVAPGQPIANCQLQVAC